MQTTTMSLLGNELLDAITDYPGITYYMNDEVKKLYGVTSVCCYEMVISAFKKYEIYRFMCKEVKNNFNLSLSAMKTSKKPLKYVVPYLSNYLKTNEKFALCCIPSCPGFIFKLSHHMKNELLLLETATYEPSYVQYFDVEYKNDVNFAIKCISKNMDCYQYFDKHIQQSPLLLDAYYEITRRNINIMNYCFAFNMCDN